MFVSNFPEVDVEENGSPNGFMTLQSVLGIRIADVRSAFVFTFVLGWFVCPAGHALQPRKQVSQYVHSVWRVSDGTLPGEPNTIAQTLDGYLWVGTTSGLLRYDGVRFVEWQPPSGHHSDPFVESLFGASDGTLWIGTRTGISRLKDGSFTEITACSGRVSAIREASDGTIWIARQYSPDKQGPFCSIEPNGIKVYRTEDAYTSGYTLTTDSMGNVWMGGHEIVKVSRGLLSAFRAPKTLGGPRRIGAIEALGTDHLVVGMVARGKGLGLLELINGRWSPFVIPGVNPESLDVSALHYDRDGALWIGTLTQGLYHVSNGHTDHFDAASGLSGLEVDQIYEDREGDIWVVTSKGIDRFRNSRVTPLTSAEGLISDTPNTLAASPSDGMWVGEVGGLNRVSQSEVIRLGKKQGFPGEQVSALYEDEAGVLWVGVDTSLYTYRDGHFTPVLTLGGNPLGQAVQIVGDGDRGIWMLKEGPETIMMRIMKDHSIKTYRVSDQPSRSDPIGTDIRGGVVVSMANGDIGRIIDGDVHIYHAPRDQTQFAGILPNPDGSLWAATEDGIVSWDKGTWHRISTNNGLPCKRIFSIVRGGLGQIWGTAECGTFRLSEQDLKSVENGQRTSLKVDVFDQSDGARASPGDNRGNPVFAPDGRLWFISGESVEVIDPRDQERNSVVPPVHLEQVIADENILAIAPRIVLAPLTRQVEIDYTALSLVAPQRVYFRYRLENFEREWHSVGVRRQAIYTNLPPGTYRFQVIACNNDGLWNTVGDSVSLVVPPAFYQAIWFRLGCACLLLAGVWAVIVLRVRNATESIRTHLAERLRERERIARELHDTLLQGFHGLMLRFRVASRLVPSLEPASPVLNDALDRADRLMTESRDRIRNLRHEALNVLPLPEALAAFGQEKNEEGVFGFKVVVEGTSRDLVSVIREEIYFIGREALLNAFMHSRGTSVELDIRFDDSGVRLRIRDDGIGMNADALRQKGAAGHWGLSGMHERAENIGAQLSVWNRPGSGCEVELKVPASLAYKGVLSISLWQKVRDRLKSRAADNMSN